MREPLPRDPPAESPVSEELREEARRWEEPPEARAEPARTRKAPERERPVRYDLD